MTQCDLSIVIVSYNVDKYIIKCIASISKFLTCSFEIIMIDNASADNTVKSVSELFPDVIIILNKNNEGFPAANNQGFKIAKGKYILMLNPDTELIDNSLIKLIAWLDEHEDIVLIGPKLLNTDGTVQCSTWRFPKIRYIIAEMLYLHKLIGSKNYNDKDLTVPNEVNSVSGAAMLFRRDLFDSIGMLDERLFWAEDIDYCYRIKQKGMKIIYYPYTAIIHHIGQSSRKNYRISLSNQVFSKIKFYKIHHSQIATLLLIFINLINSILKFIIFLFLSPFNSIYFNKAKAYLYTIPRVFNPPKSI